MVGVCDGGCLRRAGQCHPGGLAVERALREAVRARQATTQRVANCGPNISGNETYDTHVMAKGSVAGSIGPLRGMCCDS
jgi:hypothetical protein